MNKEKKYLKWICVVRAFAIICVLINHSVEETFVWKIDAMRDYSSVSRLFGYITFSIGRLGVPLFLLISGYLLLDRNWTTDNCFRFWKHNWLNLLICTELWWVILEVYINIYVPLDFKDIVMNHLFVKPLGLSHTWYMSEILGIYILIPFVGVALQYLDKKALVFPILLYSFYEFVCPIISKILVIMGEDALNIQLSQGFSSGKYGLYIIFGYLIKKKFWDKMKNRWLWTTIIVSLVGVVGLQLFGLYNGVIFKVWYDNVGLLLASIAVLIIISRIKNIPNTLMKIIENLSKCSFGIYIVHETVLQYVKLIFSIDKYNVVVCTLLRFSVTFLISWIIIMLISKIPKLGNVLVHSNVSK